MPRQNPRTGGSQKEFSTTRRSPPQLRRLQPGGLSPAWPLFDPVLTSVGQGWRGIELARLTNHLDEMSVPPLPWHRLILHLGPHHFDLMASVDSEQVYKEYKEGSHLGEIAVVPAGVPSEWSCKNPEEIDVLHLYLTEEFLREVAQSVEVDPNGLEIVPRLAVEDPQIERIGLLLKAEAEAEDLLGGKLYVESLANTLAVSLIRKHSSLGKNAAKKAASLKRNASLSKGDLKEAIDYVGDNLEKNLTLAEIAGAAHISPYHFLRLFREATGRTPHQYVIERRVERAKELLSRSTLTVSEVALSCGFADQSHLTRHFKRLMGLTPADFRKAVGGKESNNGIIPALLSSDSTSYPNPRI